MKKLSTIEKMALNGEPIHVVEGRRSDDPDVYDGKGKAGDPEFQFSDGPAGARSTSEDYLNLAEGIQVYRAVNPNAVFVFDLL